MIHSVRFVLRKKEKKIERDRFKQKTRVEREMKNSFETIKIISWLFFNRMNFNNKCVMKIFLHDDLRASFYLIS
jgi:hypothetical protein